MTTANTLIFLSLLMLLSIRLQAQEPIKPLTSQERQTVLDSIASKLDQNYVFPEMATQMIESLRSKKRKGAYKAIQDPQEFASLLTTHLQEVSQDKHLRVSFEPQQIAEREQTITAEDSIAYLNRYIARLKRNNFGFKEVKILEGNIGYLDLRSFSNVEYGGETAVAAMNFLSNTDAIIIDLRNNGGGSPAMIQLISSYLFASDPVHLNNFYWRPSDSNSQTWTLPHVPGQRSPETPVYVLTSPSTFSAAEEFSYNLKNLERATLVGRTTGGGAHPGGEVMATERFTIWVPTGRAINPITNTNWEGTGVSPHIEVAVQEALEVAHINALETLKEQQTDEAAKAFYEWPMTRLKTLKNPITLDAKTLQNFVGGYGPRKISLEKGTLYYQRDKGTKYELYPFSDTEFMLKGLDSFRIRFVSEGDKIIALQGLYNNGRTDKNQKNKD